MQCGHHLADNFFTRSKAVIFFVIIFSLCFLNINVSLVGNAKLYIGQLVLIGFISWGILKAKRISKLSLKVFSIFFALLLIASFIGRHNEWFYNDLVKIILLAACIFMYVNLFDNKSNFAVFIKIVAWTFLLAVIFFAPLNLDNIYYNNRLVIEGFGKGGEDLGWAAAVIYILLMIIINQERNSKTNIMLMIALLSIVVLSLSRDAMLTVAVYSLLSKKRRFIWQALAAIFISLVIIYASLMTNIVSYKAFMAQNGYRFLIPMQSSSEHNVFLKHVARFAPEITSKRVTQQAEHKAPILSQSVEEASPRFEQYRWILTGRTLIWATFIDYFSKLDFLHKVFGCGIGSVTLSVKKAAFLSRDAHNLYIDILFNFGILGLLLFVIGVVKSALFFLKQHANESLSILVAILSAGMFNGLWRFSSIIWLTGLIMAAPFICQKIYKKTS